MAQTFTSDLSPCNLHTAAVTDYTFITHPFVFSAMAFPIPGRAKDSFTEEAVPLRFKSTIIDSFRFFDLSTGPGSDLFRRSKGNSHAFKVIYV